MVLLLQYIKLYLTFFQKRINIRMFCCINTHLTIKLLTCNKYSLCKSLYVIVTHIRIKGLYIFCFVFKHFSLQILGMMLKISHIHRSYSMFNNTN